jgi:sulfite oxidase
MFKRFFRNIDVRTVTAALSVGGVLAIKNVSYPEYKPKFIWHQSITECATTTNLPEFRRADVQREARENKKVWVTYKDGVYDLTKFAKNHPGGSDKLLMAAGGPIEPFW